MAEKRERKKGNYNAEGKDIVKKKEDGKEEKT